MKSGIFVGVLLGIVAVSCGILLSWQNRASDDFEVSDLLRAQAGTIGIRQNRYVGFPRGFSVIPLSKTAVVVTRADRTSKKMIVEVRRMNDGAVIHETAIALHALGTGGCDCIDAVQTFEGKQVAFAGTNGETAIWDIDTDQIRYLAQERKNRRVNKIQFAKDGRLFVHNDGSNNHRVEVWDVDSGRLVIELPEAQAFALNSLENIVLARNAGFDEVDGATYQTVRHWVRAEGESIVDMIFLPDGRLMEQDYSGQLRIRNFNATSPPAEVIPDVVIKPAEDRWDLNATYDPHGYVLTQMRIAARSPEPERDEVRAWDAKDGRLKYTLSFSSASADPNTWLVSFIPLDENRLATVENDGTTKIWDIRQALLLKNYPSYLSGYVHD